MAEKDYYEVLGVERDADAKTIKRAFLKLARKYHPDVNKEEGAEERFKEINEAYSVLSDERKRANYDRYGTAEGPGDFGSDYVDMSDIFGGGFGIDDIFNSFFGGNAQGQSGRAARTRGRDMGITLSISLEEAAAGCTKTVSYERLAPCDDCGGTGSADGSQPHACHRCGGTGRIVETQRTIFGQMQSQTVCPECGGTGKVIDKPCETCNGQGRTPDHETIEVTIPAGVHAGQSLSFEGKGEAGLRGDRSGKLVVTIDIAQNKRFERQGDDLFCSVEVDGLEAILGTSIEEDGILEGERVSIKIPAGCQTGEHVRVEGKGMPRLGSHARGSLIAVVGVKTPTDLSPEELDDLARIVAARKARLNAEGSPHDRKEVRDGEESGQKPHFHHHGRKTHGTRR